MNRSLSRWQAFWENKTVPLHRQDSDEHYVPLAHELRILFQGHQPNNVLDIGCGNGALYQHLGFNRAANYRGIDFSPSMLERFHEHFPQATLVSTSGHSYHDEHRYDLIFSNGVVQYFDRPMLAEHFSHVAKMLTSDGKFICASIPWKCFRRRYLSGHFGRQPYNFTNSVLGYARCLFPDSMGRWFEWSDFVELGRTHGLSARFYGSLHYPYRFHVVLQSSSVDQSLPQAA